MCKIEFELEYGTEVYFGDKKDPIKGHVRGYLKNQGEEISYRVVWYADGYRQEAWFKVYELWED